VRLRRFDDGIAMASQVMNALLEIHRINRLESSGRILAIAPHTKIAAELPVGFRADVREVTDLARLNQLVHPRRLAE